MVLWIICAKTITRDKKKFGNKITRKKVITLRAKDGRFSKRYTRYFEPFLFYLSLNRLPPTCFGLNWYFEAFLFILQFLKWFDAVEATECIWIKSELYNLPEEKLILQHLSVSMGIYKICWLPIHILLQNKLSPMLILTLFYTGYFTNAFYTRWKKCSPT